MTMDNIGLGDIVIDDGDAIKLRGHYAVLKGITEWQKLTNPPVNGRVVLSLYDIDEKGIIKQILHPYWW